MGLGNSGMNSNSGNRGSNWRYEYDVLKALNCIIQNTSEGGPDTVVTIIPTSSVASPLLKFRSLTTSNTGEVIKAVPGNFYKIRVVNRDVSIIVVKLYNKATAPTSADIPIMIFTVPAGDGSSFNLSYDIPTSFLTGLGIRTVTGTADNSVASPAVSPIVEIEYI